MHFHSVMFDIDLEMLQMKKDWFSFDGLDRFYEGLNSLN